jgi:DNA polymerase-1
MSMSARCDQCGLKGCRSIQPEVLEEPAGKRVAIVGTFPGPNDIAFKAPFKGRTGELLRASLSEVGIEPDQVWFTYAVLCRPPGNRPPSATEIACCSQRLFDELAAFEPHVVIACGEEAAQAMNRGLAQNGTIYSMRGRPWRDKDLHTWIVPTLDPAYLLKVSDKFLDFYHDLQLATKDRPLRDINPTYEVVTDEADALDMLHTFDFKLDRYWSIDIETTSKKPKEARVLSVCFSIACDPSIAYIIDGDVIYQSEAVREAIQQFMNSRYWTGHNSCMYDELVMEFAYGIKFETEFDTLLAHYLTDERGMHGLEEVGRRFFGMADWKNVMKPFLKEDGATYANAPKSVLYKYQAKDTCVSGMLCYELEPILISDGQLGLLKHHLQPLARALARMEMNGALIDQDHLKEIGDRWERQADKLTKWLQKELRKPNFNVRSPKQVAEYIYDELGLPVDRRKGRTTEADTLDAFVKQHPDLVSLKVITKARQFLHLRSTYSVGILKRLDVDGRIRTRISPYRTATGRLASSDPNLQNIPQVIGPKVRNAFIASPGKALVEGDYSQLELRVAALYSGDTNLIDAFMSGVDLHTATAAKIFKKTPDKVSKNERHIAKMFNFGILYGRGGESIAEQLGCSAAEGEAYLQLYLATYPQLAEWMEETKKKVLTDQELISLSGYRRRFPLILPQNRNAVQREGLNFPVQNYAGVICEDSVIRMIQKPLEGATSILTVHDSILSEVDEDRVEAAVHWTKVMMESTPYPGVVPYKVNVSVGKRWGELKEVA